MAARLSDLKRAAKQFAIVVERPGSGSHWKTRRESGGACYPIPAPNGERSELDEKYLKGFCRHFGLDYETFKKSL